MIGKARITENLNWRAPCVVSGMWTRISRLFVIKTKFEAFLIIYGLGAGAVERGTHYLHTYPGPSGWLLFLACAGAVFMAGDRILQAVEHDASH